MFDRFIVNCSNYASRRTVELAGGIGQGTDRFKRNGVVFAKFAYFHSWFEPPAFLSPFLPPSLSFTETQPKNPSSVSLHHRRRKEWHPAAVHPSVYLASLVIQLFNPRSLSPIAAASSSSASVVFVCSAALPPPLVAVNVRVFVQPSSSFAFFPVQVCSAFTSPFTVRVRVRLEATLPCFKLCDQRAPPSRRTALFCRRRNSLRYIRIKKEDYFNGN
ncbi:hypothetical protein AHAS_Ahas03G0025900 [Arachis hypogaea]